MELFEENYSFECPYCMETNEVQVDLTAGESQQFVTDCTVCCHPILIKLTTTPEGVNDFTAEQE